ncbi:MAG: hypothetical protein IJ038_03990 [Clostridia bacterium]|nr:hypothetical protein [Clostridia bacterium]
MSKKNSSRVIIIAAVIIALVLALVLGAVFIAPVLSARDKMSEAREAFEAASDDDVMIITDPLYNEAALPDEVTAFPTGDEALDIADALISATEKAKYSETRKTLAGSWDISVSIGDGEGSARIYFSEEEFYVAKGYGQYVFTPNEDKADEYAAFYERLKNIISEKA